MAMKGDGKLLAGIDFRKETPQICYQSAEMKEPDYLPLDFGSHMGIRDCFRKVLSALKRIGPIESIQAAVVLPDMGEETIKLYWKEACEAGLAEEQVRVLGEMESAVHFVMRQTNDIWQQRVWFLEFGEEEIRAFYLRVNHRTLPLLVEAQKPESWQVGSLKDGSRDKSLAQKVKERFGESPVSAVFLSGTDLNTNDYKKSREAICFHRRVFIAEHIYARGACILAGGGEKRQDYLFLNEHTLLYNVGIHSSQMGKEATDTLVSAGGSWYEAGASYEMLLFGSPVLELVFQSMLGGEPILKNMPLTGLPARPPGTSRLLVEIHFTGLDRCAVKVADLGFGEIYPASDLCWEDTFYLKGQEEGHGPGENL